MKDSSIAKLLYYFFKALGLVPMIYNPKKSFCTSSRNLFYNVIFMSNVFAMNCYAIKLSLKDNPAVQFDRTIDSIHTAIGALTCLILVGMYCFRRKKCVQIANRLKALYELLTFHQKDLLMTMVKKTCLVIVFTYIPLFLATPFSSYQAVLYFTAIYFRDAIISSVILQYSLILGFCRRLFAIVNNNFTKLTVTLKIQFPGPKHQLSITKFLTLRDLYMNLSEICEEIDKFYSLPALLCIFYIFSTLIISAYYVVKVIFFNNIGISTIFLLHCFAQLIHGLTVLFTLAKLASTVIEEIKLTGKIINNIETDSRCDRIMSKVNMFSSYLLHQNIQFSAAGLFLVDGTLLMSIVGSITTYIVILLQFQDRNSVQH